MVLRDRDADGNAGNGLDERLYVQQDAQGNVTALVDTSGSVLERSVEDPYGVRTVLTGSFGPRSATLYDWKYYHQGLRLDASGTLYDNRARMYSPTLMRFLQNDPLGFGAGDPNTYRYEGNGPTGGLDPGGEQVILGYGPGSQIPSTTLSSQLIDQRAAQLDAINFKYSHLRNAVLQEQQSYYWEETKFRTFTFLRWLGGEMEMFTGGATCIATGGLAGGPLAGVGLDDVVSATRSWNEGRPVNSLRNDLLTTVTGSSTMGVAADILAPIGAGAWATRALQSIEAAGTVRPTLPPFDGRTTQGVLVSTEGKVIPFQSGNPNPLYANYPAAGHVEGHAAIWIRENSSMGGVLYHNNPSGTCAFCNAQVPTLLPESATLSVVPPFGTVAPPGWFNQPFPYIGNSNIPKLNPKLLGP